MQKKQTPNLRENKFKNCWISFREWRKRVHERQRLGNQELDIAPEACEDYICQNCGYMFRGHYCPNCGQSSDTKRITMKSALNNLFTTLIGGDSVFLRTCGNLMYRPGYMVRDFLCGKRTRYFRPVQMLLCLVTIYALFSLIFKDRLLLSNLESFKVSGGNKEGTFANASQMLTNFFSNTVAFSLVFAFVNVFPFKWMFHRCTMAWLDGEQRRLNTAEHFFTLIYISCLILLVKFVMSPLHWIPIVSGLIEIIAFILPVFISTWTYKQLLEIGWWKSLWRNIVASAITMIFVIILLILYFGIYYGVAEVMKS